MPSGVRNNGDGSYAYQLSVSEMRFLTNYAREVIDNHPGDNNGVDRHRRLERNVEGYMAEYCCCAHYGAFFGLNADRRGSDSGVDFTAYRYGKIFAVGVKSVREDHLRLAVPAGEDLKEQVPDIYISCVVNRGKRTVRIRGLKPATDVFSRPLEELQKGKRKCHCVDTDQLYDIPMPLFEMDRIARGEVKVIGN